ncbi:DUF5106 domain-containing protein [uncultured Alistipes sp.]|uniref:DUF5106 domain-containing protein n=1 Tax=uncultured Alistipes sp. TaxID=538949 RepID=UPI00262B09DB|nr:DUF5106 domain-containing protein [uncultured Alistipes sp.]
MKAIAPLLLLLAAAACGGTGRRPATGNGAAVAADAATMDASAARTAENAAAGSAAGAPSAGSADELPLAEPPAALRTPRERASWMIRHFWDAMEFRDTLRSRNRDFMEQQFANFVSLFPHADTAALAPALGQLVARAAADREALLLVGEIAEKYLYDPNSPMLDEGYFIRWLEALIASGTLDEAERIRPTYLLGTARKNRPGMPAADFTYITRDGRRQTLHGTEAEETLLLFYDPDCDHCREIMEALASSERLRSAIAAGGLTLLALYADGDRAAWDRTKEQLPAAWIVGFDTGAIRTHELYVLPAMPTLYLLDRDKRVLVKDLPVGALLGS